MAQMTEARAGVQKALPALDHRAETEQPRESDAGHEREDEQQSSSEKAEAEQRRQEESGQEAPA